MAGGALSRRDFPLARGSTADGSSGFPAAPGRYHLYLALACPWCHRTLLFRTLKRLEGVISVSFVEPLMLENGWTFAKRDPLTGARYAYQIYHPPHPPHTAPPTMPTPSH